MPSRGSVSNWFGLQLRDISAGGVKVLGWKIRSAPRKLHLWHLVNGFWALPIALLIRALRPVVLVRIGTVDSGRIGHFVPDGAEQVARLQQQPTNTVDWFWLGKTCNSQWERMIRRSLPVHALVNYVDWWNRLLPGGIHHERPSSYTGSRDYEGLYAHYDVKIPFLGAETDEALEWLRSKGWSDGEPFVCLLVRDDEYLAHDSFHGNGNPRAYEGWSYHNYRDSDIDTFLPAIGWLAAQGVWVIRMGKLMARPLPTDMDHVIDYAFDPGKSDLLDIWLFANCSGCISTGTGPDQVSFVYDIPLLFVNFNPVGTIWSYAHAIFVPKLLRWRNSGQSLSISEHLTHHFGRSVEYDNAGIDIVDMTESEITSAVQEFWQRIAGTWLESYEDQKRQAHFWDILMHWPPYPDFHGARHPEARAGSAWLRTLDETGSSSSDLRST